MAIHPSLTRTITRCHRELDEMFLVHQEALLQGRFHEARVLLDCYEAPHELHKTFEDEHLLPRHASLTAPVQWQTALYDHEHRRIGRLMEGLTRQLETLMGREMTARARHRAIIALLEEEKTLKGVVEHHQEREERGLLPELDGATDDEWRATILAPFVTAWDATLAASRAMADGIAAP